MRSRLEVVEVSTGDRQVLQEFDGIIEAPNWLPDGNTLLYNSQGRLWLFDLESRESRLVDTGDATRCNNDHVLSPDGVHVGLSSAGPEGHSLVYVASLSGGGARQVTPIGPSYLHGWSPDGKTLAYCAERHGEFDIYTIPAAGGEETRLTDAPGLNDGPEYSPDGKHIWFNSVRSGLMQVWRMNADGSQQTRSPRTRRATAGSPTCPPTGNRWPTSPTRRGMLPPGDHPPCKDVEIRLMDPDGRNTRVLVSLFGGQGTLNVNSWSPDGTRLAFVSYQLLEA